MLIVKKEIDSLKEIHNQVEKLLVTLTSSLQIILGGTSFEKATMEKIRVKILKDTVNVSEKLMEVITPYIVELNEENIEIIVVDKNGGLENVAVDLYYEDEKESEYSTDADGKTYINAPEINHDNYFTLRISKDEYYSYWDNNEITVTLMFRDSDNDLKIQMFRFCRSAKSFSNIITENKKF